MSCPVLHGNSTFIPNDVNLHDTSPVDTSHKVLPQPPEASSLSVITGPAKRVIPPLVKSAPYLFSTSAVEGIEHLPRNSISGTLTGHGLHLTRKREGYEFVDTVLRPHCAARPEGERHEPLIIFLGGIPTIYLPTGESTVFNTRYLTHASPDGEISSLGFLQDVFHSGHQNALFVHAVECPGDTKASQEYKQTLNVYNAVVNDKSGGITESYTSGIYSIATSHFQEMAARSAAGEDLELGDEMHKLTLDAGGHIFMGFKTYRMSDLIREKPEVLPFFKSFVGEFGKTSTYKQLMFNEPAKQRKINEVHNKLIDCLLPLIKGNYADLLRNDKATIRGKWVQMFPEEAFPDSYEKFIAFGKNPQYQAQFRALIIDQAFVLMAASETTALPLNFLDRELMNRPDAVEKIRNEVEAFLKKDSSRTLEDLNLHHMEEFPYLSSAVMEVLRLYPPVPVINWQAREEYKATVKGREVTIPKHTFVVLDHEMANREWFGDKDGAEFRPERWLEEREGLAFKTQGFKQFLDNVRKATFFRTFSGALDTPSRTGPPRMCPGRMPAAFAMAKDTAILFHGFNVSPKKPGQVSVKRFSETTLRPAEPLNISVEPRQV